MSIHDYVENRLSRIMDWVNTILYSSSRFSKVSISSASGNTDTVEGQPNDPNEHALDEEVRRMQSWGVHSVPPKGVDAAVVRLGGSPTNSVAIGFASDRYAPTGLNDGETALYSKSTKNSVKLLNDGSLNIGSDTGSSKDVVLNGGTHKVARVGDSLQIGTLSGTVAGGVVTFVFTPFDASGVPTTPVQNATTITILGFIANSGGATNVKA